MFSSAAIIGLVLGLLGGAFASPARAAVPPSDVADPRSALELKPCPAGSVFAPGLCGQLTTPEQPSIVGGRRLVKMRVVVLPALEQTHKSADPIIYFSGGPGYSAIVSALSAGRNTQVRRTRDLIVLEQRGNTFSDPQLYCGNRLLKRTVDLGKLKACHDRLVGEGVPLEAYDSPSAARDFHELKLLMGLRTWNVFGVSYGTRLALTYARDFPADVRTITLDSPSGPQKHAGLFRDQPAGLLDALSDFFKACAARDPCATDHPNLEGKFVSAVIGLQERPVLLNDGRLFSGANLVGFAYELLNEAHTQSKLPDMIEAAAKRDIVGVIRLTIAQAADLPPELAGSPTLADGRQHSVMCRETLPFSGDPEAALPTRRRTWPPAVQRAAHIVDYVRQGCAVWPMRPADPRDAEPVSSPAPTLLLSGEFDPSSAVDWGRDVQQTLPRSFRFVVPSSGHVQTDQPCPRTIMAAFLDKPTQRPDGSCLEAMIGPISNIRPAGSR